MKIRRWIKIKLVKDSKDKKLSFHRKDQSRTFRQQLKAIQNASEQTGGGLRNLRIHIINLEQKKKKQTNKKPTNNALSLKGKLPFERENLFVGQ